MPDLTWVRRMEDSLVSRLKKSANPSRAVAQEKYLKNIVKCYGLTMPEVDDTVNSFAEGEAFTGSDFNTKLALSCKYVPLL
jgi:hypothetical protein